MKLRKQVLGADYVERSMAGPDEFSMPTQELSTDTAGTMCGRGRASLCAIAVSSTSR